DGGELLGGLLAPVEVLVAELGDEGVDGFLILVLLPVIVAAAGDAGDGGEGETQAGGGGQQSELAAHRCLRVRVTSARSDDLSALTGDRTCKTIVAAAGATSTPGHGR